MLVEGEAVIIKKYRKYVKKICVNTVTKLLL